MKHTGKLILAAVFAVSLAGLTYAGGGGAGGAAGAGGGVGGTGSTGSGAVSPGTTPGTTTPGSDIGRTPGIGTETTPGGFTQPSTTVPPMTRPGESSLGIERQPLPPASSVPPDSGLPPPPRAGEGQGTGSGLGSPTPGLGGSAPSNPAGSMGSGSTGGSTTR